MNKLTKEEFIRKAREVHGWKFDYSKVEYKDRNTKVCIVCPEHGEFYQSLSSHLCSKYACPKCGSHKQIRNRRLTKEEFIARSRDIHGDKYDYSKVEYKRITDNVCIICPEHGEFWQRPQHHMNGFGCTKCSNNYSPTTEEFIKKAKLIHGDRYDYSKTIYKGADRQICIICPKHGEFWQRAINHLKWGCNKCGCERVGNKLILTTDQFIENARKIHGDKYDYSKVEYKGANKKVCIICPKHGEFWQQPVYHIHDKNGCPMCIMSKSETEILNKLKLMDVNYIFQCRKDILEWLGLQTLDFFLPDYNIAVEYQGLQHFRPFQHMNCEEGLQTRLKRDINKFKLCKEHNVTLYYILTEHINKDEIINDSKYEGMYNEDNIITMEELFNKLKNE